MGDATIFFLQIMKTMIIQSILNLYFINFSFSREMNKERRLPLVYKSDPVNFQEIQYWVTDRNKYILKVSNYYFSKPIINYAREYKNGLFSGII